MFTSRVRYYWSLEEAISHLSIVGSWKGQSPIPLMGARDDEGGEGPILLRQPFIDVGRIHFAVWVSPTIKIIICDELLCCSDYYSYFCLSKQQLWVFSPGWPLN